MSIIFDERTKELLSHISYFQGLGDMVLREAANEIEVAECEAGQILFLQGEVGAGLHLVATGLCKVYYMSPDGREQILYRLAPRNYCNEVSAADGGPNPANFAAIEASTVWILREPSMQRLRQRFPELNDILIRSLANHARQLANRIYQITFLSVKARLALFLIQQCNEQGQLERRQWPQDEIAAHLGTVRDVTSRSFKELRESGLIEMNRSVIQIKDRAGLLQLTQGG